MSQHAKEAMLDNIKQNLIEMMAEYLDSEDIALDEMIAGVEDPTKRENSDLHERMAEAAFEVYRGTVVDVKVIQA